ncbi:hypothetical protein NLG97_g7974 [Lecanicillium saksenae]|uniref:Uncharacterized protein n=1 Tax=Lecanicillium saksenae TaxID=468837 RepID=A0ACC1QKC3_9HYPO|nr:hypothetical protein NLG97_g7974 [Lecanicillium saksenae]
MSASESANINTITFDLGRLPPEVRQLIWEATLPGCRVFHVRDFSDVAQIRQTKPGGEFSEQRFEFHICHAPPIAHAVCRESRRVVLLHGSFLFPSRSCVTATPTGPWFNSRRDMLYLDRNMRHCLRAKTPLNIVGLDHVLHIGLEWRAWFRDVPQLPDGEKMSIRWKAAIQQLLLHCPRLESLNFVLPRVRRAGGVPSGREPYYAENYHCKLTPLPERTRVPWERAPVPSVSGGIVGFPGTALSQIEGSSMPVQWGVLRGQMESALRLLNDGPDAVSDGDCPCLIQTPYKIPLAVKGWWLVRLGMPTRQKEQEVQEFWS